MNKTLKVILVALLAFTVLFGFAQTTSLAVDTGVLETMDQQKDNPDVVKDASEIGGTVVKTITTVSIVISVIALTVIGVKYIIGSTQEKAEYKKSLIPLVVGILVIVFASVIVRMLFSVK